MVDPNPVRALYWCMVLNPIYYSKDLNPKISRLHWW